MSGKDGPTEEKSETQRSEMKTVLQVSTLGLLTLSLREFSPHDLDFLNTEEGIPPCAAHMETREDSWLQE